MAIDSPKLGSGSIDNCFVVGLVTKYLASDEHNNKPLQDCKILVVEGAKLSKVKVETEWLPLSETNSKCARVRRKMMPESLQVGWRREWRRQKSAWEMRENQLLETHLKRIRGLGGRQIRIWVSKSWLQAMASAASVTPSILWPPFSHLICVASPLFSPRSSGTPLHF